jgi:hypothetical protein
MRAGYGFDCTGAALTISAVGSNVGIDVSSVTLTNGATLGTCTPTAAPPFALDPSGTASVTCVVNIPASALLQSHFEQGFMAWTATVGAVVAKGSNTSANAAQNVTFNKTLTQTPSYTLSIKRVPLADAATSVSTAGELSVIRRAPWGDG